MFKFSLETAILCFFWNDKWKIDGWKDLEGFLMWKKGEEEWMCVRRLNLRARLLYADAYDGWVVMRAERSLMARRMVDGEGEGWFRGLMMDASWDGRWGG